MKRTLIICMALLLVSTTSWAQSGFIAIDAGGQFGGKNFTQAVDIPGEAATTALGVVYPVENAPVFDIAGGLQLTPNFGVGATVSLARQSGVSRLFAWVPLASNPVTPVLLEGFQDVDRYETGIHLQAIGTLPISERLTVSFYGGPSWIQVNQDLVANIDPSPETAGLKTAETQRLSSSAWGFNVGGDVSYFFTDIIGIGGGVRYTRATVEFDNLIGGNVTSPGLVLADPGTTESRAGGTQVIGGIRFRFR